MTLFTEAFLDKLQEEYKDKPCIIDQVMESESLNFHDTVIFLAKQKGLEPEYFQKNK